MSLQCWRLECVVECGVSALRNVFICHHDTVFLFGQLLLSEGHFYLAHMTFTARFEHVDSRVDKDGYLQGDLK